MIYGIGFFIALFFRGYLAYGYDFSSKSAYTSKVEKYDGEKVFFYCLASIGIAVIWPLSLLGYSGYKLAEYRSNKKIKP